MYTLCTQSHIFFFKTETSVRKWPRAVVLLIKTVWELNFKDGCLYLRLNLVRMPFFTKIGSFSVNHRQTGRSPSGCAGELSHSRTGASCKQDSLYSGLFWHELHSEIIRTALSVWGTSSAPFWLKGNVGIKTNFIRIEELVYAHSSNVDVNETKTGPFLTFSRLVGPSAAVESAPCYRGRPAAGQ